MVATAVRVAGRPAAGVRGRGRRAAAGAGVRRRPPTSAGADGLLLLPPYLVSGTAGRARAPRPLRRRRPPAADDRLPAGQRACSPRTTAVALLDVPTVVGFKDGIGDVDAMLRHRHRGARQRGTRDAGSGFLNGLPTAELTVQAYRAIGVDAYSSRGALLRAGDRHRLLPRGREGDTATGAARSSRSSTCRLPHCATRCPATRCRWSRPARACRASTSARCGRRWSTRRPSTCAELEAIIAGWPGGARRGACRRMSTITEIVVTPIALPRPAAAERGRACTSRGRCAPSSRCTPTTAWSGSARPTATHAHLGAARAAARRADRAGRLRPERPRRGVSPRRSAASTRPTGTG